MLGKDSDVFFPGEEAAVSRLAASHRSLEGPVDTKSEAGYNACATFLEGMDTAARTLGLEPAPRGYRTAFTINYRSLFPDEARNYRVDILEASVEQYSVIWVNGDKFEFSAEAMRRAEALQFAWREMTATLQTWNSSTKTRTRPLKSEIKTMMVQLDYAWASFEHKYIAELIEIEEKARRLIVQAIKQEHILKAVEDKHGTTRDMLHLADYQEALTALLASIGHLNSVANHRRKGRDDLTIHVLLGAHHMLDRCDRAQTNGESTDLLSSARHLAEDVVSSFLEMRAYLNEVGKCLDRVDPQLCDNVGLVAKLVHLAESWEVGARYVQHEKLMAAICDVVAECKSANHFAPGLAAMWQECDVQLFLVLPRLLWLRLLGEPAKQIELFKTMLPHRFPGGAEGAFKDSELFPLLQKYEAAIRALATPVGDKPNAARAREVLITRATDSQADLYTGMSQARRHASEAAVEDLMYELEIWSMELQRHCPDDWNGCAAIIVSCLSGSGNKSPGAAGSFRV